jgi:hypothetical protein
LGTEFDKVILDLAVRTRIILRQVVGYLDETIAMTPPKVLEKNDEG